MYQLHLQEMCASMMNEGQHADHNTFAHFSKFGRHPTVLFEGVGPDPPCCPPLSHGSPRLNSMNEELGSELSTGGSASLFFVMLLMRCFQNGSSETAW